jgi:hypothetical protein
MATSEKKTEIKSPRFLFPVVDMLDIYNSHMFVIF